jgi:hypothetical protein
MTRKGTSPLLEPETQNSRRSGCEPYKERGYSSAMIDRTRMR